MLVSPLSIDMYLPAFPQTAKALGTRAADLSLTISSYFLGLAAGQFFYGPLVDRYGRKGPFCCLSSGPLPFSRQVLEIWSLRPWDGDGFSQFNSCLSA